MNINRAELVTISLAWSMIADVMEVINIPEIERGVRICTNIDSLYQLHTLCISLHTLENWGE